ncbi:hypothetical protein K8R62_03375, partial [bacterium]|nr:hypothetical protein [bacterium]
MKAKIFFTIFLTISVMFFFTGCASTPRIGNTGSNGAIPFVLTQSPISNEKTCQPVVTPRNIFKTGK